MRIGVLTVLAAAVIACAAPAAAQESRTIALTKELTDLLDKGKLDSIAAREEGTLDQFVAALYFPGSQLLAISAKYAAPALLNEKIVQRQYREVYLDLNAATDPATRIVIEDLQANGLHPTKEENEPPDFFTRGTGERVPFDGDWKKRKVSEEDYMKSFREADAEYVRMLESLLAEAKKPAK